MRHFCDILLKEAFGWNNWKRVPQTIEFSKGIGSYKAFISQVKRQKTNFKSKRDSTVFNKEYLNIQTKDQIVRTKNTTHIHTQLSCRAKRALHLR
jgi:hypothetical protein